MFYALHYLYIFNIQLRASEREKTANVRANDLKIFPHSIYALYSYIYVLHESNLIALRSQLQLVLINANLMREYHPNPSTKRK